MPQLANLANENYCAELVDNGGNQTQAYLEAYPNATTETARANGSALLTKTNVRERVIQLMNERKALSLPGLSHVLEKTVTSDDPKLAFEGTRFGFKLHGAIDGDSSTSNTHQHLHLHQAKIDTMTSEDKLARLRALGQA